MSQIRRTADETLITRAADLLRMVDPDRLPLRGGITNRFLEEARTEFYRIEDGLGEGGKRVARQVDGAFDFSKHNWAKYTNDGVWILTQGEDFNVTPGTMRTSAKEYAKSEGYDLDFKVTREQKPAEIAVRFRRRTSVSEIRREA